MSQLSERVQISLPADTRRGLRQEIENYLIDCIRDSSAEIDCPNPSDSSVSITILTNEAEVTAGKIVGLLADHGLVPETTTLRTEFSSENGMEISLEHARNSDRSSAGQKGS